MYDNKLYLTVCIVKFAIKNYLTKLWNIYPFNIRFRNVLEPRTLCSDLEVDVFYV